MVPTGEQQRWRIQNWNSDIQNFKNIPQFNSTTAINCTLMPISNATADLFSAVFSGYTYCTFGMIDGLTHSRTS